MQRTIKFRGKRVDNGEWVYGYGVVLDWEFDMANIIHSQGVNRMQCTAVDPATVGQFTGLTDKNNSGSCDIYEGDCVSLKGIVIGNIYEKMDKGEPYIIIPKITSRDWVSTYEILLDSGCEMPK